MGVSEMSQGALTKSEAPNLQMTVNQDVYHAVYIPQAGDSVTKDDIHIYQDKVKALEVIKKYKNGRLKSFKDRAAAEEYAKHGNEPLNLSNSVTSPLIPPAPVKGPSPQELVAFRKLIEENDLVAVHATAHSNPRYLFGCGYTPAILQEGARYNALHVAVAKTRSVEMCKLILELVATESVVERLFGPSGVASKILIDRYLNTPDKGLNETPLHFAVKFGLKDIVQLFVSHPQCIKTRRNKFDQMPIDIICTRRGAEDEALKKDIRLLLEDHYYVPVLSSEDDTLQPTIGEPFSPTSPPDLNRDLMSPRIKVRAFAGPMYKDQALEFRKKWKTPPRNCNAYQRRATPQKDFPDTPVTDLTLKLRDTEKGLEIVGRNLAEEYHVAWKEYWPFLNEFADFRCTDGLRKLEKYLETAESEKFSSVRLKKMLTRKFYDKPTKNATVTDSTIETLCKKLETCMIVTNPNENNSSDIKNTNTDTNSSIVKDVSANEEDSTDDNNEDDEMEFYTPPSSPEMSNDEISEDESSEHEICENEGDDEEEEDEMELAVEGRPLFLDPLSKSPTKVDYAVFYALSQTIDPETYPNIYKWKHTMQLIMKRDPFRGETPESTRRRQMPTEHRMLEKRRLEF